MNDDDDDDDIAGTVNDGFNRAMKLVDPRDNSTLAMLGEHLLEMASVVSWNMRNNLDNERVRSADPPIEEEHAFILAGYVHEKVFGTQLLLEKLVVALHALAAAAKPTP